MILAIVVWVALIVFLVIVLHLGRGARDRKDEQMPKDWRGWKGGNHG